MGDFVVMQQAPEIHCSLRDKHPLTIQRFTDDLQDIYFGSPSAHHDVSQFLRKPIRKRTTGPAKSPPSIMAHRRRAPKKQRRPAPAQQVPCQQNQTMPTMTSKPTSHSEQSISLNTITRTIPASLFKLAMRSSSYLTLESLTHNPSSPWLPLRQKLTTRLLLPTFLRGSDALPALFLLLIASSAGLLLTSVYLLVQCFG